MAGTTHDGFRHHQRTTFPRTHPHNRFGNGSHPQQNDSSPWNFLNCDMPNLFSYDFPPTPDVDDRKEYADHGEEFAEDGDHVSSGRLKSIMDSEIHRHRNHLRQAKRERMQSNYPRIISFKASDDDVLDDITGFNDPPDPPLELGDLHFNEISLEESFGFEKDEEFERLYNETDDAHLDDGQGLQMRPEYLQSQQVGHLRRKSDASNTFDESIGLNSYHTKDRGCDEVQIQPSNIPEAPVKAHHSDVNVGQNPTSASHRNDKIFRSRHLNLSSAPITPNNHREIQNVLSSPAPVMDRRRSSRPATSAPVESTPSYVNSISPSKSITSRSSHFTPPSIKSYEDRPARQPRNRSASRSKHRSRSKSTSHRRRSRSRSTSKAPSHLSRARNYEGDDYHSSLFRGAALIREQLLRSMASTDQMMDEADQEFLESMIEKGRVSQDERSNVSRVNTGLAKNASGGSAVFEDDVKDNMDFDYSVGASATKSETFNAMNKDQEKLEKSIPVSKSESQTTSSSALETESHRLDILARIFAATSSTSSAPSFGDINKSTSNKENKHEDEHKVSRVRADPERLRQETEQPINRSFEVNGHSESISEPITVNASTGSNYAKHYLRDNNSQSAQNNTGENGLMNSVTTSVPQHPQQGQQKECEALTHARFAGSLWRSLVGNHVRFPSHWNDVLPPTDPDIPNGRKWSKWYYVARHRVKGDKRLNSGEYGVRSRRSGGRILLRMVVREMHSQIVCREVAIGCLHPNAKGIRAGDPQPTIEDVREVWMAVRWVMNGDGEEPLLDLREERYDYEGVVDTFLTQKRELDYTTMGSVLGRRKLVNNENVRAVFGDKPPMTTVDFHEDELAEILKSNGGKKLAILPALMLLKLFLF
mmetsp:Transcript_11515/g.23879  ORF Transcript_11515/g.23879 Transcript_11515/m.23879 type:complete len:877 (-) Transcript_11515:123-2753(-)